MTFGEGRKSMPWRYKMITAALLIFALVLCMIKLMLSLMQI
jgi:hypothetical protein